MNRRSFLATLAGLPLVGWLFPHPETLVYRYEPTTTLPEVKWRDPQGDMEKAIAKMTADAQRPTQIYASPETEQKIREYGEQLKPHRYVRRRRLPKMGRRSLNEGVSPRED